MSDTSIVVEPGTHEIVITHTFDAPRELVFRAYTDPRLIVKWWGPRYLTTILDGFEPQSGGRWRMIHRDAEGNEYAFHGVFHDVSAPERIVQTFEFEGMPGHVSLETATFEDVGGRTLVTGRSVFQSVVDRDGMVASGMEVGVNDSNERLAELLAELKQS